jgi:L,D-transpeptidase ErfK/SrfK
MKKKGDTQLNRRQFVGATAAGAVAGLLPLRVGAQETATYNASAFRMVQWQDYFTTTKGGMILTDIESRALHFWSEDLEIYRLYPCSVPLSEDLTRRGRTKVVQKVVAPTWRPTPSMKERNPEWPNVVPGGDPNNPLGSHALYLSWTYYRIHGTHDTRKIGRKSSNGCIGLYNEHIAELFEITKSGAQVLLI